MASLESIYLMVSRAGKRDAHATFAGFVFQVNVTILRWLDLQSGQHLALEAGEDIDLIQAAAAKGLEGAQLLEQVKQLRGKRLTLRSADALEAIANFCQHRSSRPEEKLAFRFLTTTSPSKERQWNGRDNGIVTWEKVRNGKILGDARKSAIREIKAFLKNCFARVPKAVRKPFVEAVSSDDDQFAEVVDTFEWAMGSGDHKAIQAEILQALEKSHLSQRQGGASRVYRDLFAFVFHLLTEPGPKKLTQELLSSEIRVTEEELLAASRLRYWIDRVDATLARHDREIRELQQHLPVERAKTFYQPKTSAEYTSRNSPLFDFDQTLRGRRTRIAELDAFLNDPTQKIAVLPGRGGIGKTKLMRAWSENKTGWQILWASQHGVWHEGSINEIPPTNTLLIVDDAHLYDGLDKIVSAVSSRTGAGQLKLLIGTRPSGVAPIDGILARLANSASAVRFKKLSIISLRATVELAKEVLGPKHESQAERLAEVSKDTPLITVVGGKLIARGEITPNLLLNHEDFRAEVFNKFLEERTGELPSSGQPNSVLLGLVAALQPVDPDKDDFVAKAAVFLSLRPDQIHDGLDFLEGREVLVRVGGKLRIVPDLFADYLLELASIYPDGRPKGYADAVFALFESTHLVNLLRNFGELEWRFTRDGEDSRLMNEIWSLIQKRFQGQDAADRRHLLRTAQPIAVFHPVHIHKLIKIAMDQRAASMKKFGVFRATQVHILALLPALLGVTIYTEKVSADAFARLWELAHHESSDVSGPAQRTLKSAIGYERDKYTLYNERFLGFVEKLSETASSYDGDFTPFNLVTQLLVHEYEISEWRNGSFRFTRVPVPYEMTKSLRERALRVIDRATYSADVRTAVSAVRSFMSVLGVFQPSFRPVITPEEQAWQDRERLAVLAMLRQRLNVSLPLAWKIHRILRAVEQNQGQSSHVRAAAAALHTDLHSPDLFELFDTLCTNEYEDADGDRPSQQRRDRQTAAIADLQERFPNGEDQVATIEQLFSQISASGISLKSGDSVMSQMCRSRAFLEALSEYALKHPRSIAAGNVGIAIGGWRHLDRAQFARYGGLFARSESVRTAASVAWGVSHGAWHELLAREDLEILTILANRSEPAVLHETIYGLKRLTKVPAFRHAALDLIAGMKIDGCQGLAQEYIEIFGHHGLPGAMLTPTQVEKIFTNLVEVEQLRDHAIDGLLTSVCGVAPKAIVSFLEARIVRAVALEQQGVDSDYEPIPTHTSWSVFRAARNNEEYNDALAAFVDLMKRSPRYEDRLSVIFWRMADVWPPLEETGTVTFAALDRLLHTSESEDALIVVRSIEDAPLGLAIHDPMFALHILWTCAALGENIKDAAMNRLVGNCFASGGVSAVQPGVPVLVRSGLAEPWQQKVIELLSNCEPGSLAFELFKRIADCAQPVYHTLELPDFSAELDEAEEE
jgi:hypothetical protein